MKPVHSFVVTAKLPGELNKLRELAYNYWWCWNPDGRELFRRIDADLWEEVSHNPVNLINRLSQKKLNDLANSPDFISFLKSNYYKFESYLNAEKWYNKQNTSKGVIAYFSTEYGINESFPNYSGGLGVLSGDHLKSASDLGLPLVGVGLLYQMGYFRQHLTQSGWQNEIYLYNDFYNLPITLEKDKDGNAVLIDVDLPLGKAYANIWSLNIGNNKLYLLDTNIKDNVIDEYRDISDQLYGGTRETRIQQEILLGIGGIRALKVLGIEPQVVHINEGHAAFSLLERTKEYMVKFGISFYEASQITINSSVFTTHTPVPAGNEEFHLDRIENYFKNYYPDLNLTKEEFIKLGQIGEYDLKGKFSMTVLGLKMSAFSNGVSKLHGKVSAKMWHPLWKCFPAEEVPIKAVTNGIHTMTWVAREFTELYDRYLSPVWRSEPDNQEIWNNIDRIPAEELYREKQRRRVRLILFARNYLKTKQKEFFPPDQVGKIDEFLDTHALTIGFARRFATYKRALLVFRDMERLAKILKNPGKPVQIIIAGKAHPHDTAGKEVIQGIIHKVREYGLDQSVVFLEDYDMVIGRLLVKGCDVWLNTPIRPLEASGTSGMKAAINGTLNLSIPDGWWDEAYNGKNGFSIGEGKEYSNSEEQDIIESDILYELLEQHIVPMFYDRKESRVPYKWVNYMKESIKSVAPYFSTSRMVKDYATTSYFPALKNNEIMIINKAQNAVKLNNWKDKINKNWNDVKILEINKDSNGERFIDEPVIVSVKVSLGELTPEDVSVQIYHGRVDPHGELVNTSIFELKFKNKTESISEYQGEYFCNDPGMQGFTVRILPTNSLIVDKSHLYICRWPGQQD